MSWLNSHVQFAKIPFLLRRQPSKPSRHFVSLSLPLQALCEELRESDHVLGRATQTTSTIVTLDLRQRRPKPNMHKKLPKYYRQLRHGKHHMYSTPLSFVPVARSQQVLTTRREEAQVNRHLTSNRGKSLTSDSSSSTDLPSEESEPDRHQGSSSHAKSSCLFCSIPRRCSTKCQNLQARRRH